MQTKVSHPQWCNPTVAVRHLLKVQESQKLPERRVPQGKAVSPIVTCASPMHPPHASTARENGGYHHHRQAQGHHQGTGSIRSATRHRHSHSRLLPHQHQRPLCRCAIRIKLKFNNTNYNSHEAGASAYLQAPYYEKLTAVVVYEVVGGVTIPYACTMLCACMLTCPLWGL